MAKSKEKSEAPKRVKGRPAIELTDGQIETLQHLAAVGCTLDMIARRLRIAPCTLDRLVERDERVKEAIDIGRADGGAKVLQTAYGMATDGKNPWMTSFWLKCKLGWKEPKDDGDDKEPKKFEMNYKK